MRLTVNLKHNVAYIHFQDRTETVNTIEASEDVLIDIGPDGTVYGIELLNAREQLRLDDLKELEVSDEDTGITTRVPLPFASP